MCYLKKIYRAAKYIRTSCPDDELQYRDSVANQSKLIDEFLLLHPEITLVDEKIDDGYSGLFFDRPAFTELVADIEAGRIDCVIMKDLSRLGRSYIDVGKILRDLFQTKEVRFISIDDNFDSLQMNSTDKIIILIKSIFSEQYSCDISVKTRSSLDAKRKQGQYVGAIPIYGYQKSDEDKHKLSIDPNTYTVVQSIFQMKLQGLSAAKIATALNDSSILSPIAYKRKQGIPFPSGGFADKCDARWSATTVLRILRDENYTGILVQGRQRIASYKSKALLRLEEAEWSKTENAHFPIISKSDFIAVQRVLALDTRATPQNSKVLIFSGLLICGCCRGNMTRKTVPCNGRHYIYYYCPTGKRKGCASAHMVREKDLLRMVTHKVRNRIADIQNLARGFSVAQIASIAENECIRQIAECTQHIHNLRKFRERLYDSVANGVIDTVEFQAFQKHYDAEIARIDVERSVLRKTVCLIRELSDDLLSWTQSFLQFSDFKALDRIMVVKLIQRIHILGKNEIAVDFVCQCEYEQLVRYRALGGHGNGEKKSKTK